MLKRLFRPDHGHRALDDQALALNLSFVLHERSDSAAVRSAVRAIRSHASIVGHLDQTLSTPMNPGDIDRAEVALWLTATIGIPHLVANALNVSHERILSADSGADALQPIEFFRAPANLYLPSEEPRRIGVGALILRPDRRTSQLVVTGVHDWPMDRKGAIRSLERLIQAHVGQWVPSRALWLDRAESLLPDEIY